MVISRTLRGSCQLVWMMAERSREKWRLIQVTSSTPRVMCEPPQQFTRWGISCMMCRMIEMSCGARSQATLMSRWNRPRLSRREAM